MYLYVNSKARHMIFNTLGEVLSLKFSDSVYEFTILNVGDCGKYDLIVTHSTDKISKNKYIMLEIVKNMDGKPLYKNNLFSDFFGSVPLSPEEKRFQVLSLFPENILVNGYLPVGTKIPPSIMDNFEELMKAMDTFFTR